jgi:hypothetical protein
MIKDTLNWDPINYQKPVQNNIGIQWVRGKVPEASGSLGVKPTTTLPSFDEAAVMLLERTNPFRPVYSVPVEFVEMITLMTLFKTYGSNLLTALGGERLLVEWELKPFRDNIKALDNILAHVEARIKEFNSLVGKGGLHRRIRIAQDKVLVIAGTSASINSSPPGTLCTGIDERIVTETLYGSVRWYPKLGLIPPPDPIAKARLALRVLLDLNPGTMGMATAWEAIPFSWLIDYFTNVGSLLAADRGRQIVYPAYISVSKKTTWVRRMTPTFRVPNCQGGAFTKTRQILERRVYPEGWSGTEVAVNVILNENQFINILAVIAVLRGRQLGQ